MNDFHQYITITKVDEAQRIVSGIASDETLDSQGEVVDAASLRAALPDYLRWKNIREMHMPSAVGKALRAEMVGDKLELDAYIGDDTAWKKVCDGIYQGFSIGGDATRKLDKDATGKDIRRAFVTTLTEISLVDRPANPNARFIFYKREDSMPPDTEEEITATPPATDSAVLAAVQALAGKLEKAAGDPTKIISQIQALRNDAEIAGDTDAAQYFTQAIAMIQMAVGDADTTPDAADDTQDTTAPADGSQPLMQSAKPGTVKKAGRVLNQRNLAAMQQTLRQLLQLCANAGDVTAGKALALYTPPEEAAPLMMDGMKQAAASVEGLTKALQPQLEALAKAILGQQEQINHLLRQPAAGGPQLRPVGKLLNTGDVQKAAEPTLDDEIAALEKMARETVNPDALQATRTRIAFLETKRALAAARGA